MHYRKPGFDSLLGQTPDGFVILKELGSGASSVVYQALQPDVDNRLVALKVMNALEQRLALGGRPDVNPFDRELQIAQVVRSPAIVRIFQTGRLPDGRFYVAMEYVQGMTLEEELKHRGRVPWPEVAEVAERVASAVGAMHDEQIVHRDLKPGNVMVRTGKDEQIRIKLIDFGVAKLAFERDDAGSGVAAGAVGSPQYMAPETARGQGCSYRSDVYAVGAITYELLSGKPVVALRRPTPETCLAYLRSDRPLPSIPLVDLAPEVPEPLVDLVGRCLARDPGERPANARVLEAAILRAADLALEQAERDGSTLGWLKGSLSDLLRRRRG